MQIVTPLRQQLLALRYTGRWREIAREAGCDYATVAKIARGLLANPGSQLCERLFTAIKATEPRRRKV